MIQKNVLTYDTGDPPPDLCPTPPCQSQHPHAVLHAVGQSLEIPAMKANGTPKKPQTKMTGWKTIHKCKMYLLLEMVIFQPAILDFMIED